MPVYEYECTACGHKFEELQKITDRPLATCPACHRRKVHRLISQSSFVLKGSGWYVTDYGKGNSRTAEKAGKKDGDTKAASGSHGDSSSSTGSGEGAPQSSPDSKEPKSEASQPSTTA